MKVYKKNLEVDCEDAYQVFARLHDPLKQNFLFESRDVSQIYGRLSLIGVDPVLEIRGKDSEFEIKGLNERAKFYFAEISNEDLEICDEFSRGENSIKGRIVKVEDNFDENDRTKRRNIAQIIRILIVKFHQQKKEMLGLYGAFSYDFVRLFEDIPDTLEKTGPDDFRLLLYDTFVFFDHLKERAEVIIYRDNEGEANMAVISLAEAIGRKREIESSFSISNDKFDLNKEEYGNLVIYAKDLAKRGELFEVVYSNTLRADFSGDPLSLYKKYREVNPSPYLFYFNFADEQLIGASPEMMVRCEHGIVNLRPISGTAKRGRDPIEDHENMVELLKNEKERAELDMLIDLGRNDLARICEPGITISDYRFVEKYSKVMHTVAHLSGRLKKGLTALDALIACVNAGTLTGAPKVAAMIEIEKMEKTRRGYYGGTIGYLTFSGEMDTGIIIRTAHIKDGKLSFRVGATLLYDSVPEAEYEELLNKARAFLTTFSHE